MTQILETENQNKICRRLKYNNTATTAITLPTLTTTTKGVAKIGAFSKTTVSETPITTLGRCKNIHTMNPPDKSYKVACLQQAH